MNNHRRKGRYVSKKIKIRTPLYVGSYRTPKTDLKATNDGEGAITVKNYTYNFQMMSFDT